MAVEQGCDDSTVYITETIVMGGRRGETRERARHPRGGIGKAAQAQTIRIGWTTAKTG